MTIDDDTLKQLAQDALRQALEAISEQLRSLANDPAMRKLNGQDALNAAANAILSNNSRTWGDKRRGC